jgi:U32 family peptidase
MAAEAPTSEHPRLPHPELLAPAGHWDALRAAVANGADAVYFGLEGFNARARATNFKRAELPQVLDYLHARNVAGYVTLNTLIFPDELDDVARYLETLAHAGADAVIVQDLGLIRLIRRMVPTLPVHASTQMTQTEAGGIEWLRSLGVARVILARELSLHEIGQITRATPMALEVFVHGALCISYSGQCLASAALCERSANRGVCAQACRLPYELIVDGRPHPLGERNYLLSPQDLAAHAHVARLCALGVTAFKIEGRLKSADYVAAATRVYRSALDAAIGGRPFVLTALQTAELDQGFSRGLTPGFLEGVDHQRLVQGRSPKHRGALVGVVTETTSRSVIVELSRAPDTTAAASIKPGDGLVFDDGHPEHDEPGGRVFFVKPVEHPVPGRRPGRQGHSPAVPLRRVELTFGSGDVALGAIAVGSRVWKTDDPAIRRGLEHSYRHDRIARRLPLRAVVRAVPDQPLQLTLSDDAGHEATVTAFQPLAEAYQHPLTLALLREQLGRLGQTPFELVGVELIGAAGPADTVPLLAPKSVLNELRRRAVEGLLEQRAAARRHAVAEPLALEHLRPTLPSDPAQAGLDTCSVAGPHVHVLTRSLGQFEALVAWAPPPPARGPALLYGDFSRLSDQQRAVARAREAGRPVGLATPQVLMPGDEPILEALARAAPDAVLVRNLAALAYLRRHFPELVLIGDHTLNAANDLSLRTLIDRGLTRVAPCYDLPADGPAALTRRIPAAWCEIVIHHHVPLFHLRHCLLAACLSDAPDCRTCDHPCQTRHVQLRDRAGADHPVLADAAGRTTVFQASARSGGASLPSLTKLGFRHFRLELLEETGTEACRWVESVLRQPDPRP